MGSTICGGVELAGGVTCLREAEEGGQGLGTVLLVAAGSEWKERSREGALVKES
jgi:hypothetical protein